MRKLSIFNFTTLNGFYKGLNEDINWHRHGGEESAFSEEGAQSGNTLLFGRVTYEMMASFWPTPMAHQSFPVVADGMNKTEKIVFSRTLKKAEWNNTKVISENIIEEVKKMKQSSGKGMTILGSGSILTQFAEHGLIDEYQFMIDPVALGDGTPIFKGLTNKLDLKLTSTKTFKSGVVLVCYVPM
jgi:dihydrofolate reductase